MKKLIIISVLLAMLPATGWAGPWTSENLAPTFTGTATLTGGAVIGETLGTEQAASTCAGYTYSGATSCTDGPLTFTRTASASNLTLTQTTITVVPGHTYEIVATTTISASTITLSIGGVSNTAWTAGGTYTTYITAGTNGTLTFTFTATSAGTISAISVKDVTSVITSADAAGVTFQRTLTDPIAIEHGVVVSVMGTKAGGSMNALEINDAGSGGTRNGIMYSVLGVQKLAISNTGTINTASGFIDTSATTGMTINRTNSASSAYGVTFSTGTWSGGAGVAQGGIKVNPTYNQSSTASGTDYLGLRVETAIGSGAQRQFDLQITNSEAKTFDTFNITNKGHVNVGMVYGAENVLNPTMAANITNWSGANWAYNAANGGGALHTAGATTALGQTNTVVSGQSYYITYTVVGRTAGQITLSMGGVSDSARTTNATFTKYLTATATTAIAITPDTNFDGMIQNVFVYPVGPAITTCGTAPAVIQGSNDHAGSVTLGTGSPTACTLTFATAYTNTPSCTISGKANATVYISAESNAAITVTGSATYVGFNYSCRGLNE